MYPFPSSPTNDGAFDQQSVEAMLYASPSTKRKHAVSLETIALHSAIATTREPADTPKISAIPKATIENQLAKVRKTEEKRSRRIRQEEKVANKERLETAAWAVAARAKGDDTDISTENTS